MTRRSHVNGLPNWLWIGALHLLLFNTASQAVLNVTTSTASPDLANSSTSQSQQTSSTTTTISTTATPNFALARVLCQFKILSEVFSFELEVAITERFRLLAEKVSSAVRPAMTSSFGQSKVQEVSVKRFWSGSVNTELEFVVEIVNSSNPTSDTSSVTQLTNQAMHTFAESNGAQLQIDSASILVKSVQLFQPTLPPPTPEVFYNTSRVQFSMRAPNEVFNDNLTVSSSDEFRQMEANLKQGTKDMLSTSFLEEDGWHVETSLVRAWNDSVQGVWMTFTITISPQWRNTSDRVSYLGKNYVFFSRLGTYQIEPRSVTVKDLTSYAPHLGVIVIDDAYRQKIIHSEYNGTYIGDFVETKPRKKTAKIHEEYLFRIAIPAFVGMMILLSALFICTATESGKEKFYHQM